MPPPSEQPQSQEQPGSIAANLGPMTERVLFYPQKGKGRISINRVDYKCLGHGEYLNDVIVDFYLQYVHRECMTPEQREKTHIFGTYFYTLLSTPVSQRSKPYNRVKRWTNNVDIFEKEYIIIPIVENSHWFLAVICFPGLNGPVTYDSLQPLETGMKTSSKIEGEIDASEAKTDEANHNQPIKQPCILIFDSLACESRTEVVKKLHYYLTCEYKAKNGGLPERIFTEHNTPGQILKVPQQTNSYDCGPYLLQYVEQFFNDPVKNFELPILHLSNWFETIVVTRKREEVANLIKSLVQSYELKIAPLPEIALPTVDGKLVPKSQQVVTNKRRSSAEDEILQKLSVSIYIL